MINPLKEQIALGKIQEIAENDPKEYNRKIAKTILNKFNRIITD